MPRPSAGIDWMDVEPVEGYDDAYDLADAFARKVERVGDDAFEVGRRDLDEPSGQLPVTVSVAGSGDHGIVWVEFEADGVDRAVRALVDG